MDAAIKAEDFDEAARLQDRLKELREIDAGATGLRERFYRRFARATCGPCARCGASAITCSASPRQRVHQRGHPGDGVMGAPSRPCPGAGPGRQLRAGSSPRYERLGVHHVRRAGGLGQRRGDPRGDNVFEVRDGEWKIIHHQALESNHALVNSRGRLTERGASKQRRPALTCTLSNVIHVTPLSIIVTESSFVVGSAAPTDNAFSARYPVVSTLVLGPSAGRTWDPTGGRTTDRSPVAPSSRPCTCTDPRRARVVHLARFGRHAGAVALLNQRGSWVSSSFLSLSSRLFCSSIIALQTFACARRRPRAPSVGPEPGVRRGRFHSCSRVSSLRTWRIR